jgi:FtsP/CotA-like multicopper oxidase with cupredoxin domain
MATTANPPIPLLFLSFLLLAAVLTQQAAGITVHKGGERAAPPQSNTSPELEPDRVDCPDRKKACECRKSALACRFVLTVEELQTFTSYKLVEEHDEFLGLMQMRVKTKGTMRTTAGDTYYLDGRGYTPTLPPREVNRPPEYGDCYLNDTIITEETFARNNCTVPITVDGATFRMFIGINGQIPGPTLIVHNGQEVQIRVVNKLTSEGISVHWHGMRQRYTPWMDGVGLLSQPPLTPGAHFDYIFKADPPGTHWYHSHIGAQRTDGLYGSLIVKETPRNGINEMGYTKDWEAGHIVDNPREHTISFLDWQSESSLNLFVRIHSTLGYFPTLGVGKVPTQQDSLYLRTHSADGIEVGPVPYWSGLMNGMGRHNENTFGILSTFTVKAGENYRFRLVGAQSLYAFKFSIDGHKLHLTASDGRFIERVAVDYIIIHTGERYDFILRTKKDVEKRGNFWMRAETLEADATERHSAEGILHYDQAEDVTPDNKYTNVVSRPRKCRPYRQCVAVNCPFKEFPHRENTVCIHLDRLKARHAVKDTRKLPKILPPSDSENLKFFNFGFEGMRSTSAINGMNFKFPTTPYQTYCEQFERDSNEKGVFCDSNTSDDFPVCVNVAKIASSAHYVDNAEEYPSVNFVLSAVGDIDKRNNNFSHPIHLHGHTFYVVAVQHGEYNTSGKLNANNPDVSCDGETCHNPRWTDNTLPPYLQDRIRVGPKSIRKDTVIVPAGGYVVVAFLADNPGYWFMHCHIESHQLEGMAVIVQEYPSNQQWAPPKDINRSGNFEWTIDQYTNVTETRKPCSL